MSRPSPSPQRPAADSEPAPATQPPTLPPTPSDLMAWAEADLGTPPAPPHAFPTQPQPKGETEGEMPTIGHIGRYALKYRIGAGGLGTVYAAHDPLLSRLIAIKTLNLELPAEERDAFNSVFLNEARAAGGLSHPHIVTVFDAGIADGCAYIAMELLKGRDLRQLRQEGWRPTPQQAATIVRRVADALAFAHSKGVVHRDIKPANIFMVGRTQPRVLDFGIARIAHQHEGLSGGDLVAGSPYYMAPEQVRQETVDRRADVFSLGVVLYELLTERKPFTGSTLEEITNAVLEHVPPRADAVAPAVPHALAEIAARAMEKDPEHRYRSARTLSRELRHWLEEHAQQEAAAVEAAEAAPAAPRRRALIGALAALPLLAVGGWAWQRSRAPSGTAIVAAPAAPAAPPAPAGPLPAVPLVETPVAVAPTVTAAAEVPAVAEAASATPPSAPAASTSAPPPPIVAAAPAQAARAKPPPPRPARERPARPAVTASATGLVRLAVSPWGQVEVDGTPVGVAPPLNELTLSEGRHQITLRNADFPALTTTVVVEAGQTTTLRHRFGS